MPAFQVVDQKLSGQRAALERGQNPLPLYLSLSVKENSLQTLDFKGTILSPIHCVLQYTHTPKNEMDLKQIILTRERHTGFTSYFYVSSLQKGEDRKKPIGPKAYIPL